MRAFFVNIYETVNMYIVAFLYYYFFKPTLIGVGKCVFILEMKKNEDKNAKNT